MTILSLLLVVIGIGAAAVIVTLIGVAAVRRHVGQGVGRGHNEMSAAIFTVGGTIYAVFLALLVVAAWEAHDAAKDNAADEASQLCTLYRGSTAMEPESGGKLRALIREYTHAVITDEWPKQARDGGTSEEARRAGLGMFRVFGATSPAVRQSDATIQMVELSIISQVQSDRNRRTLQSKESLSPLIWWTAAIQGILVIVMSFFLYPDHDWAHVVMSSILTAMVFLLIYVVFVFARPFSGVMRLQPDAFEHSLEVYDAVDRAR